MFIGEENLKILLKTENIIDPQFKPDNIKNGAYELTLGDEIFLTDSEPRKVQTLNDSELIYISPGQFALLLTEEIVTIPKDKIAFISIKAGIKFKGLVNVSGFHVDPGFSGKLLFSVYNAGPHKIALRRGQKCFPIWFAELNESQEYSGSHEKQYHIPIDPIEALSQGDLASPAGLLQKMKSDYETLDEKIGTNFTKLESDHKSYEKEQKALDYLVKATLGLGLVLVAKFLLDWSIYNDGVSKGIEIKQKEATADSVINQLLIQKRNLLKQIDSLKKDQSNTLSKKGGKNE